MKELDKNTTGLILGTFAGLVHLLWAVIVGFGFGQVLLDFIYSMHFLNNPFSVSSFDVVRAVMLVVVTFVVGYVGGWVFAAVWNTLLEKK